MKVKVQFMTTRSNYLLFFRPRKETASRKQTSKTTLTLGMIILNIGGFGQLIQEQPMKMMHLVVSCGQPDLCLAIMDLDGTKCPAYFVTHLLKELLVVIFVLSNLVITNLGDLQKLEDRPLKNQLSRIF